MTLRELTSLGFDLPDKAAPDWLLGTFRRRSITFYTGAVDSDTEVLWLQSRGLSADFRVPPSRPRRQGRNSFCEFSLEEIQRLSVNEGGLGRTSWDGSRMKWYDWESLQTHNKWAEPGDLHRVGDCIVEFALSGAYVEDWRLQPTVDGPVIGLRLLVERNADTGEVLHRGGGLVVCGNHAAFIRGRSTDLEGVHRLSEAVGRMSREKAISVITSFDASYGRQESPDAPFVVELSTNPLREGEPLIAEYGFSRDSKTGLINQHVTENGVQIERLFTVDTLEPHAKFQPGTSSSLEAQAWLSQEADTLLAFASINSADLPRSGDHSANKSRRSLNHVRSEQNQSLPRSV